MLAKKPLRGLGKKTKTRATPQQSGPKKDSGRHTPGRSNRLVEAETKF